MKAPSLSAIGICEGVHWLSVQLGDSRSLKYPSGRFPLQIVMRTAWPLGPVTEKLS